MDWLGTCCILGYNDLMITSYFSWTGYLCCDFWVITNMRGYERIPISFQASASAPMPSSAPLGERKSFCSCMLNDIQEHRPPQGIRAVKRTRRLNSKPNAR